jgi:hypothetical protein
MTEGQRFFVFFGVWVLLGVGSGALLWFGSVELKRRWYPRLTVTAGVLFVSFVYWLMPVKQVLFVVIPAVTLITLLNLKTSKFCPQCGAFFQDFGSFFRSNYCRKCGHQLSKRVLPSK